MELDITTFFNEAEPFNFSASQAEMGKDAGRITWSNAMDEAAREPLVTTEEQLTKVRDYFREFGAWDDAEINAWSATEVNALLVQYISGDLRELESLCMGDDGEIDWAKAEALSNKGQISGNIYRGDDGHTYFYIGN